MAITYVNSIILRDVLFYNNPIINSVNCSNARWFGNSLYRAFENCTNLTEVTNINQNITNMSRTFNNCQKLINVPEIPAGVTNLYSTFTNCTNLSNTPNIPNSATNIISILQGCSNITTMPTIPNSITDITMAFDNCSNLTNTTVIPNSVTNMQLAFRSCTNLAVAPTIPDSVTSMYMTFDSCNKLTNDIWINAEEITNAINCFGNTTSIKNVYIPFIYSNNVHTNTYNSFIAAGYDKEGTKNGVYLKDSCNYKLNVEGFTYTSDADDNIILKTYTGTNTSVVIPNLERA